MQGAPEETLYMFSNFKNKLDVLKSVKWDAFPPDKEVALETVDTLQSSTWHILSLTY